jgi:hypothetical protein
MSDYGKKKFKQFAKSNRLRLKTSEDGYPIVVSRGTKYANCMLYEGFCDDFVGLYVTRDTPSKLTHLVGKLTKMGFTPYVRGDYEALYKVSYNKAWKVANMFNMVMKRPSNQNIDGLKNFRHKQALLAKKNN